EMVAPPGPVSVEALTFTLLKPLEGPCTTTCVSTVSPRAPDRLMEEVVPGASVFPTRNRLGDTQTLNADGVTPFTVSVAALLVATVNCGPLCERVVAGVV